MLLDLVPFLQAAVERDQVGVGLNELRIVLQGGLVLADGAARVGGLAQTDALGQMLEGASLELAHPLEHRVLEGRSVEPVLLVEGEVLAGVVLAAQVAIGQGQGVLGGSECLEEADGLEKRLHGRGRPLADHFHPAEAIVGLGGLRVLLPGSPDRAWPRPPGRPSPPGCRRA